MTPLQTFCFALMAAVAFVLPAHSLQAANDSLFARDNLVAWCIVPFDAKKRGPEERAEMLNRLGLQRLAYDWRDEHIPTFDAEVEAMKRHGIEITAWWFPGSFDEKAKTILGVIERHGIKPQLWVTGGGANTANPDEYQARVEAEAKRLRPIAEAAAKLGCKVALYNHGGWFGEPENQVAIIERLQQDGIKNVGIVYNFHHGHHHIRGFPQKWGKMQPYLLAVNINGMVADGDKAGKKILTLGQGDQEPAMLKVINASNWRGPVGILNHRTELDAEVALRDNLAGLEELVKQLQSSTAR